MEHNIITSLCTTIDRIVAPLRQPKEKCDQISSSFVSVATADQLLGKNPFEIRLGGESLRVHPRSNPDIETAIERLYAYSPRTSEILSDIYGVAHHEVKEGTRLRLEHYKDSSVFCRLALAYCYFRGKDGVGRDDKKGLELATTIKQIDGTTASMNPENYLFDSPFDVVNMLNNIGNGYWKLGDYQEACHKYKRAVELDGNRAVIRDNLSSMLIKLEKYHEAFPHLCYAAERGRSRCYYHLGYCYYHGYDRFDTPLKNTDIRTETEALEAVKWLLKSEDKHCYPLLSQIYYDNVYMESNEEAVERGAGVLEPIDAMEIFKKGAEAGDCYSMVALGIFIFNGWGTEPDKAESAKWIRKAIDEAASPWHELHYEAFSMMTTYLYTNEIERCDYLKKQIDAFPDRAEAYYHLGKMYYESDILKRWYSGSSINYAYNNYNYAYNHLRKALDIAEAQNDVMASMNDIYNILGEVCRDLKEYDEAITYYQMSLDHNNDGYAAFMIGWIYRTHGWSMDETKHGGNLRRSALEYFRQAIDLNYPAAASHAYECLKDFCIDHYRDDETLRYAEMSINQFKYEKSVMETMRFVGVSYLHRGDKGKASKYLKQAMEKGDEKSKYLYALYGNATRQEVEDILHKP